MEWVLNCCWYESLIPTADVLLRLLLHDLLKRKMLLQLVIIKSVIAATTDSRHPSRLKIQQIYFRLRMTELFMKEMHILQRFHLTQLLDTFPGRWVQVCDSFLLLLVKQLLDNLFVHLNFLFLGEVMIDRLFNFGWIEMDTFVLRESRKSSPASWSTRIFGVSVISLLSGISDLLLALSSVFSHDLWYLFVHVLWW